MRYATVFLSIFMGLTACRGAGGTTVPEPANAGAAEPVSDLEHAFYGAQGEPASLEQFVDDVADVDFIGFGEFHYHAIGSQVELQLLEALADQERPIALAMEFFEADTQTALDDYLAGRIEEPEFLELTKRNEYYDDSHRPLVEFCKEHSIDIIAANAPRPLVTAYRKSGMTYEEYLASLTEEERALMPVSSVPPDDEHKRRFMELMGPKRGPSFFKSMALWNDAMAESAANYRGEHPEHRVLLIVGAFHVAGRLGTMTEYAARRPDDSSRVLVMTIQKEGPMVFTDEDRDEGDLILKIRMPTKKK
ncbi:MAG: ChaN family lipoprotein [Myxococcota bacterium]